MILGFKTIFPWGQVNFFEEKIKASLIIKFDGIIIIPKIHTIRKGNRWRAGVKIHFATGVRSKGYRQFAEAVCTDGAMSSSGLK